MTMDLRDQIAAMAMQGFIAYSGWHPDYKYPEHYLFVGGEIAGDSVARAAYKYADAMLKVREEK